MTPEETTRRDAPRAPADPAACARGEEGEPARHALSDSTLALYLLS